MKVDINLKISTARHSWGTSLMRLGVPMEYISKGYGHSSFNVTALYLGSFTQEQIENYSNLLHNKVVNKKNNVRIIPEKGVV